jgi:hypothetical protein
VTNQLQVDIRGLNQADSVRQPVHPGPHAVYQDTATGRLHVDIQEQDSWVYEKEVADLRKAHPQLTPEQALHAVKQWSRRQSATAGMPGVETQQSTTDSAKLDCAAMTRAAEADLYETFARIGGTRKSSTVDATARQLEVARSSAHNEAP